MTNNNSNNDNNTIYMYMCIYIYIYIYKQPGWRTARGGSVEHGTTDPDAGALHFRGYAFACMAHFPAYASELRPSVPSTLMRAFLGPDPGKHALLLLVLLVLLVLLLLLILLIILLLLLLLVVVVVALHCTADG